MFSSFFFAWINRAREIRQEYAAVFNCLQAEVVCHLVKLILLDADISQGDAWAAMVKKLLKSCNIVIPLIEVVSECLPQGVRSNLFKATGFSCII